MEMINGFLWVLLPASFTFFLRWRLAERDAKHYRDLLIKTHAELTYHKYNLSDPKWDDDYIGGINEEK